MKIGGRKIAWKDGQFRSYSIRTCNMLPAPWLAKQNTKTYLSQAAEEKRVNKTKHNNNYYAAEANKNE